MSEYEKIVITGSNLFWLILSCILLLILPLLFIIFWKRKCGKKARYKALFIGALGFLISARVLELSIHMFCIVSDNPVSRFINGHVAVYVLYGIVMAGVFEECGRYIILRYLIKKENTRENAVMYGIGHGGIEVWVISLLSLVTYLVIAVIFSEYPAQQAMTLLHITEKSAAAALPAVQTAAAFGISAAASTVLERVLCMFAHISLTVVVFYSIQKQDKKYLLLAVFLHMMLDLIPALSQKVTLNVWLIEGWIVIWTVLLFFLARRLYKGCDVQDN